MMNEVQNLFGGFGEDGAEMEAFNTLLSLGEEEFVIVAPIALEQMYTAFNTPAVRDEVIKNFFEAGGELKNLHNNIEAFQNELNNTELSDSKKEFLVTMMRMIFNTLAISQIKTEDILEIPFELCAEDAKAPTYANAGDSGADVYSLKKYVLAPGQRVVVQTGLKVAIPVGYELQVRPKSGISAKTNLRICNTPGTIDAGYRDEIGIIIENTAQTIKEVEYDYSEDGVIDIKSVVFGSNEYIEKGQKIAQLVLQKVPRALYVPTTDINLYEGNRGGGFGSTGLK